MNSRMTNDSLRFATLLGRAVAAMGALAALVLVLAMFQFRVPYKPGFGVIIVATLLGLGGSAWWLGGLVGRAIARRGRAAVAWGAAAGIGCLGIAAFALSVASVSLSVEKDLQRGVELGQAVWDYFGKPLVYIMLAGSIPAALIGLGCAGVIYGIIAWQKKALVESAH